MANHAGEVERSNVAFKCNYCDGGAESGRVGFNGICSPEVMRYNVEHRTWCSSADCSCKQYLEGTIDREELDKRFSGKGFGCYESVMLKEWTAKAGIYQNGENKGKPMRLLKVQKNSLAILTTRKPGSPESMRFIFAVFLVDDASAGDEKQEGYAKAKLTQWKIELTPQEASMMLFWNYYANENAPQLVELKSGLFRYISDSQAVQILRKIIALKKQPNEKEFAQSFLNHFCALNGIDESAVPPPNGALVRTDG